MRPSGVLSAWGGTVVAVAVAIRVTIDLLRPALAYLIALTVIVGFFVVLRWSSQADSNRCPFCSPDELAHELARNSPREGSSLMFKPSLIGELRGS